MKAGNSNAMINLAVEDQALLWRSLSSLVVSRNKGA